MLYFAAINGHEKSQWIFGSLEAVLKPNGTRTVPQSQELDWLVDGMTGGSRVCGRRLQQLDPERYRETLRVLREDYGGIGSKEWHLAPLESDMCGMGRLWFHSTTGGEEEVRRILTLYPGIVDTPFTGETPLIGACRSGHSEIVRLLLDGGASAALLDDGGRGPLHYLSSFDTEDVPHLASRMAAAGASLDAWCWRSSDLKCASTGLDSRYGNAGGTPLLWAVQADCHEAVKALLDLGARVFPQRPEGLMGRHYSPVHWAARMHQSEILDMLLSTAKTSYTAAKVAEILNTAWESSQEETGEMLPLGLAVSYPGGLVLARILLHGADHIEQCFKTVHCLLDAGADVGVGKYGGSALGMASNLGPPYGLRALLSWKNGRHQPRIVDWANPLLLACVNNDRSVFDELLKVDVVAEGEHTWPNILARVALTTDNTRYVNAIITKHQGLDTTRADYSAAFRNAWLRGHAKVAKVIFERADCCDVIQLVDQESGQDYQSILGDLIWDAKFHPSHVKTIDAYLKCVGARDAVFEGVVKMGDGDSSLVFNALQCALTYRPGSNVSTGVDILQVLTKYFKHPTKHLASTFGSDRSSLLHMVIQMGNPPAADFLLKLPSIDGSYRNARGFTAFDACITRWQDSSRDTSLAYTSAVEAGAPEAEAREHWEKETLQLMDVLRRKGASRFGSISHMIKRLSAEELQWIEVDEDGDFQVAKGSCECKLNHPRSSRASVHVKASCQLKCC